MEDPSVLAKQLWNVANNPLYAMSVAFYQIYCSSSYEYRVDYLTCKPPLQFNKIMFHLVVTSILHSL